MNACMDWQVNNLNLKMNELGKGVISESMCRHVREGRKESGSREGEVQHSQQVMQH